MNYEKARWSGSVDAENPDGGTTSRRRRLILIAGLAIALMVVVALVLGRGHDKKATANTAVPTVTVMVPGQTSVANTITATGNLQAKRGMPVGVAGEGGMVSRVLVDAGDWVKVGQTLATVDPAVQAAQSSQMQAQIAASEADAKLAQSQLDRAQALVSRGFISKADIDQRTATRDAANAKVKLAQAQHREMVARLGRLDIRAPASGLVLSRNVEPGQIVSSGSQPLFQIAMDGILELQAKLAEQDLATVHVGLPVEVKPVGASQTFSGTVWQVSPVIDPTTRQGVARVQLGYNAALRPGGFATATFSTQNARAPVLPESAVLSDAKGNYVYVIDRGNQVVRRDVKIGDVSDTGIAILAGLSGSERVVYSAGAFLNPGEKVIPELKRAN